MNVKMRLCWAVGLVCLWQGAAFGGVTGVLIANQEHHVWGYAGSAEQWLPGGRVSPYDQIAPGPVAGSAAGTYVDFDSVEYPVQASSRAGDFRVEASADYWFSYGNAESLYVFTPEAGVQALTFHLSGMGYGIDLPHESNLALSLFDSTTGTTVVSLTAPSSSPDPDWVFDWTDSYLVDPLHTYLLTLYAGAGEGDSGRFASAVLDISPAAVIPAPGAVLLGVLGTGLAGWLRRRGTL